MTEFQVQPRPGILDIAPYVPGGSTLPGAARVIKLASNEAALGPSPRALEAYAQAAKSIHLYPDAACTELRKDLARTYDLEPERILCGSGSEYLLDLLVRTYAGAGDEVLYSRHTFPLYRIVTLGAGAAPVEAPDSAFTADVDALLAAVTPRTKIVILANPNNPTGTWLGAGEVARLREGLREDILLIVDAAYAEYPSEPNYNAGEALVRANPGNTVMTRTFSKMFALANLRVGWLYAGEPVIACLQRLRLPFCVTTPAQEAARAALADTDHWHAEKAHSQRYRSELEDGVAALGFDVVKGAGNFIFFPVSDSQGAGCAAALDQHLKNDGIIVRPIPPANAVRVTVGKAEDNTAFLESLQRFVKAR